MAIFYLALIGLVAWLLWKFVFKDTKTVKVGSMCLISGGVKTGKSTFSVWLACKEIKKRQRKIKIKNFFCKLLNKPLFDMPLLYSNIPLTVPYVPLTDKLLLREERFVYGSVIYCCEASLIADSMLIKDKELNERLLMFNKLIGHETKGGCVIYDTQCISDVHYSIKRCLSEYFYIHHLTKWLPFFLIAHVKECRYSEDGSVIQTENEDTEEKLKKVIISKNTWKKFDCYCYSVLTDNLPVVKDTVETTDLKARKILSFKKDNKQLEKYLLIDRKTGEVIQNEKKNSK